MTPLVSAVVLNYRTGRVTWKCVDALRRQTIADRMEILVVDNHSGDDSIGYLRNRTRMSGKSTAGTGPIIRVLESPYNVGYGQGNALGIAHARGTYLLIINPDNELEPRGMEQMIASMERDPTIGILAPKLIEEDGRTRASSRSFPTPWDVFIKRTFLRHLFPERMDRYLRQAEDTTGMRDVDWVAGACLLLRRDFYEQLGGFDPRFFLFFEDTDLCRRCWKAGKRVVYDPRVQATDRRHRLSEGGFFAIFTKKTVRIHLASALKYFWKWSTATSVGAKTAY